MTKVKLELFFVILNFVVSGHCDGAGAVMNLADYMNHERFCNFDVTLNGNQISAGCLEQVTESCQNGTVLATMIDASSKFPYTALVKSTPRDYGDYDECVEIDHKYADGRILGQHCLFGLAIADPLKLPIAPTYFLLSVCRPDKCTAADYNVFFNNVTRNITNSLTPFPGSFNDQNCVTKETGAEITVLDGITIAIISLCGVLMIISTAYDLYLQRTEQKSAHPLYLAFSVYSNGKKLIKSSKGGENQILVLHGIKVISMVWIIAGHGASVWQFLSLSNQREYNSMTETMKPLYLTSAVLAVDTFFYLGGFLAGWGYIKKKPEPLKNHITSIPLGYLHRYLRLSPALFIVMLVQLSIFGHFGSGPLWHLLNQQIRGKCEKNWWAVLLYIQNYHNYEDVCMLQSWYLSADMQMFIISPIVLIPLAIALKNPKRLKLTMISMFILNIILTCLSVLHKLLNTNYRNDFDAHTKLHTYFIGVMMGVFLLKTKDRPFLGKRWSQDRRKICNLFMWLISLASMAAVVVTQRSAELYHGHAAIVWHDAFKRPFWAAALSWVIYSSYYGYGGLISWMLTRPLMQIGGKLSYCIYLVHGLVVVYNAMVTRNRRHFSDYEWFYLWCGHFMMATVVAIFWTLTFESPLIAIERFIFGNGGSQRKKKQEDNLPPPPLPIKQENTPNGNFTPEDDKNNDVAIISKTDLLENGK